jgi:hypothetical protein
MGQDGVVGQGPGDGPVQHSNLSHARLCSIVPDITHNDHLIADPQITVRCRRSFSERSEWLVVRFDNRANLEQS